MRDDRTAILHALKDVFVPVLRERGFKGSLPHFHRILSDRVDYLTVQFYSSGGSFVVELASAGPDGKPRGHGAHLPVQKLNTYFFAKRLRLGSDPTAGKSDHWYEFGPRSYDPLEPLRPPEHYRTIALRVVQDFERQAEPWLAGSAGAA